MHLFAGTHGLGLCPYRQQNAPAGSPPRPLLLATGHWHPATSTRRLRSLVSLGPWVSSWEKIIDFSCTCGKTSRRVHRDWLTDEKSSSQRARRQEIHRILSCPSNRQKALPQASTPRTRQSALTKAQSRTSFDEVGLLRVVALIPLFAFFFPPGEYNPTMKRRWHSLLWRKAPKTLPRVSTDSSTPYQRARPKSLH